MRKNPIKAIADTVDVVNDFNRQALFWSYRPVAYRAYAPFYNLTPVLDEFIDDLFRGNIDEGNADTLDNIIADYARQAIIFLDQQKIEHIDMIRQLQFQVDGAVKSLNLHLEQIERDVEENAEDMAVIKERMKAERFSERRL